MSKNFEEEYKEYLNAQAPDLWNRIEAGVDALGAETLSIENAAPKHRRSKKKKQVRYQHYRMLVSVAACLFALVIIVPVYLLTRPSGKDSASSEAAPQMLEDVTIQNIVADSAEMDGVMEESAPAEESTDGVPEVQIELEDSGDVMSQLAQVTEETAESDGLQEEGATVVTGGTDGGQVASPDTDVASEGTETMFETTGTEDEVAAEEDMQVTILGEGSMQEDGVMYTATVIGSGSSETIGLFVPAGTDIAFEMQRAYTVTVHMSADGSYYIVTNATTVE